ncbi:DUF6458 family protein [Kineococcus sp. SYSU DK003]|uniref:DUF6458 family protein n=1 Tax=Kineococcus sp. SYSU DK003 TaxID=3383124 RepID=UPI003D7CA52D
MRLGSSIFLIALGAILAFAVTVDLSGIDLQTVGAILMLVGVLWLVLEFVLFRPRTRRTTSTARRDPGTGSTTYESTTRDL